jgi:putative phosphoserine phosphatase/1-acylglycerol-3-phosphate O-acyltransferase
MAVNDEYIREIEAGPKGPKVMAIFDFDGTIISGYSVTVFIREQMRKGDLSPGEIFELGSAATNFGLGKIDFTELMQISANILRGTSESEYREFGEQLFNDHIARLVYPESRALIQAHQRQGHTVAIVSSATPYQVEAAAKDLDIEHVYTSELEVKDDCFTGELVEPMCWGEGKVLAAKDLAKKVKADLADAYFYSDSDDDLELLETVGKPQVLNPNNRLKAIALEESWPIRRFESRGRPKVEQWVRSVAATYSIVPSFVAGLGIWALSGSRRDAMNFTTSVFTEMASALIGLKLKVKGEENLWAARPAVFMFNHQSQVDAVIVPRLVGKDLAGVGKKEVAEMPVIGKLFEFLGMVPIDRANAGSAIKAMEPLVEVMKNDRRSVIIAPEGTRTISPKLAPFKKGPFHLAIQAGVPVVPVVIHNATDVQPKGDYVYRAATVYVEVLPPVDTSDWHKDTINEHVAEVRNMFLRTLGQDEEAPLPNKKKAAKPAKKKGEKNKSAAKAAEKETKKKKAAPKKRSATRAKKAEKPVKKQKATAEKTATASTAKPRRRAGTRKVASKKVSTEHGVTLD